MNYMATVEMAQSVSLRMRISAASAQEGVVSPEGWAFQNIWKFASQPGWSDKWAYAVDTLTVNQNPDIGARNDVISDADILAAVQVLRPTDQILASSTIQEGEKK